MEIACPSTLKERVMLHTPPTLPRLLVSVRNADEALEAIAGGCNILDVKDPARGSLGRADERTWQQIAERIKQRDVDFPCSAALGEISEDRHESNGNAAIQKPRIPDGWLYAKLGTAQLPSGHAGLKAIESARLGWRLASPQGCRWILVIYADWREAGSPSPEDWLESLPLLFSQGLWDGVLIDTHLKNGSTLLDHIDLALLQDLGYLIKQHSLLWCVAGSLQAESLPVVLQAYPDVIGIRTAGCRDRRREMPIERRSVSAFRESLKETFAIHTHQFASLDRQR